MAYSFISKEELKKFCEEKSYRFQWDDEDILDVYTCVYKENGKIVGHCVGSVYKEGTFSRACQWRFGHNRNRELWIDSLESDPNSSCKGSILLQKVEEKLRTHKVKRQNIYVVSVQNAISFYEKFGYVEIETPDDEEDEDYPSAFRDGVCIGVWMCKPLPGKEIDSETEKTFSTEYVLNEAFCNKSLRVLRRILNFEVDYEIFYFDDEDFEEFQKESGRKYLGYTEEEFRNTFYPRYAGFLDLLKKYKTRMSQGIYEIDEKEFLPYFKNLTQEEIKQNVDIFFEMRQ